jgi:signal peptidase II
MRLQKVFLAMLLVVFFLLFQALLWVAVAVSGETSLCNSGGPFGVILPKGLLLTLNIGVVGVVGMAWWRDKQSFCGWPWLLILSGGLGNLLERLSFGCIMDYIALPHFPVFNGADVLLTIGVVSVIMKSVKIKMENDNAKNTNV